MTKRLAIRRGNKQRKMKQQHQRTGITSHVLASGMALAQAQTALSLSHFCGDRGDDGTLLLPRIVLPFCASARHHSGAASRIVRTYGLNMSKCGAANGMAFYRLVLHLRKMCKHLLARDDIISMGRRTAWAYDNESGRHGVSGMHRIPMGVAVKMTVVGGRISAACRGDNGWRCS